MADNAVLGEPVCGELLIFDTNQQFATHRRERAIRTWALLPSPPVPHRYGIVAICEGVRSFPEQCGCQKPGVCGGP